MRLLACLIVAPQRGYDEPAILSYEISSFCPTSADGLHYQEHKASLIRIQREQAEAAAAKIGQFIKEIESQLGWTTQLPWSAGSIEQRRFDALRLLRQVPAITELAQLDAIG